jgi:hypothetical protein
MELMDKMFLFSLVLAATLVSGCAPPARRAQVAATPGPFGRTIVPTEYGAKCDGRTDDGVAYAAAQRASQESGRPIIVPPGRTCIIVDTWNEYTAVTGIEGGGYKVTNGKGFMPKWHF